jgi:hypothetical protein
MAGTNLQQLLGYEMQTASARAVANGVNRILPSVAYTATQTVPSNSVTYHVLTSTRKGAQSMPYGSASRAVEAPIRETKSATLWSSVHNMTHPLHLLMDLKRDDRPDLQRMGEQEIRRKTVEFARMFGNSEANLVHSALFTGFQYWTANGYIVKGSSGSSFNADYLIPARNQNQLSGNIGTSWDNAAAPILANVQYIIDDMNEVTGRRPAYAVHGKNIPQRFLTNTDVQKLIQHNNPVQNAIAMHTIPDGFLGIPKWIQGSSAFYEKEDGTLEKWLDDDALVIFPEFSTDWFEVIQGTHPVPTALTITNDAVGMLDNVAQMAGLSSYCTLQNDPPAIKQVMQHCMLPIIKVPACLYIVDTKF